MTAKIIKPIGESNIGKSDITLTQYKGEPRVDSRLLAEQLDNKHKNSMALIERYLAERGA